MFNIGTTSRMRPTVVCILYAVVLVFDTFGDPSHTFRLDREELTRLKGPGLTHVNAVGPMACPTIVSRADWGARPPKSRQNMTIPVPFVILHHTLMDECFTYEECCKMMRFIQDFHMDNRSWNDIAYNFLVGEDGLVYEGRGWDTVGSHAPWYNFRSIGISIMGNYTAKLPNQKAKDAVQYIINCAIKNNKLNPDYTLYGHRQATPNRTCPGDALFKEIQSWPHWKPGEHFPPSTVPIQ